MYALWIGVVGRVGYPFIQVIYLDIEKIVIMKLSVLFLILLLGSCKTALLEVKSENTRLNNRTFIVENDTLIISYDFWCPRGVMAFSITNKLNVPIYADWRKSSLILNSKKLDYWIDNERRVTAGVYGTYLFNTPGFLSTSVVMRPERITFIPPNAIVTYARFVLWPMKLSEYQNTFFGPLSEFFYDKSNTPLHFNNFLTYSTTESFEKEGYVNSQFYVSSITIMNNDKFWRGGRDSYNNQQSPNQGANRFFIQLN